MSCRNKKSGYWLRCEEDSFRTKGPGGTAKKAGVLLIHTVSGVNG